MSDSPSETMFQTFRMSRVQTKMITTTGQVLAFRDHQYITADEDEIAYLELCIQKKVPGLSKGKPVTSSERDPMEALRKKIISDYLAEEQAQLKAVPDMGSTEKQVIKPAGTDVSGKLSAASTSVAAK